jgi:hypothetical protein
VVPKQPGNRAATAEIVAGDDGRELLAGVPTLQVDGEGAQSHE